MDRSDDGLRGRCCKGLCMGGRGSRVRVKMYPPVPGLDCLLEGSLGRCGYVGGGYFCDKVACLFYRSKTGLLLMEARVLLFFFIFLLPLSNITSPLRRIEVAVRRGGMPLDGMFGRVRRGASYSFLVQGGSMGAGRGMSVSTGGGAITRVLKVLFSNGNVGCRMGNGHVSMCGTIQRRAVKNGHGIAKRMASGVRRTIVNTSIFMVKTSGNAVASVGKRFSLRLPSSGTGLRIDCVNCGARMVGIKGGSSMGVMLMRSSGTLRRIIIMNCKARGGIGLAKTIRAMGSSELTGGPIASVTSTLANRTTNIAIARGSNRPKPGRNAMHIHNVNA